MTKKKARILVVDDHPIIRDGLAALIGLEPDLEICGRVADAATALKRIAEDPPDLAIVDITLGGGNGIELIKQIKASHEEVSTLVFSMHDEKLYAERALRAGAKGYVNKSSPSEEVVVAIRRVLDEKIHLSDEMSELLLNRVVQGSAEEADLGGIDSLSDREMEVFELIGRGLTTRTIADRLNLSVKTIETHREKIKVKLGLSNNNELIRRAVRWVETL
ncbi:MAG: response regulator [Candidatus Eisenbacteria bacterium]|nr:response regulator [Candidatus Latescibacterota bacterium]MBD3301198.1 response regulator [Candidatus Eisenbacteria bacterium]